MTEPLRSELDPEAAAVVREIEAEGVPEWSSLSVESARRVEDEVFSGGDPPEVEFVRDLSIPGSESEIPIRVYRPGVASGDPGPEGTDSAFGDDLPVLVYYHGGGWVLGTLDSIDGVCRRLARRGECVVVSVDYRLAPEHPFPAAVEDARAALRWVAENAGAFGGDPERVAVGGTSAGGNLAAVTALGARASGGRPTPARQFLFYPITDRAFDTDSYAENAEGPLLTRADMEWFWDHYLRSEVDAANPYASPLRARDLSGLPPATVLTAGFDPLRDEGIAYAERLADAGVEVRHDHYPGMVHGFLSASESIAVADEALDEVAEELRAL
ncbi:alpha/beta hydrolase [Halorussus salilacus]|uniref:alpha/beta hydrolase n=1 Tax=Halorussus salilacus TaxID=2953750 RepID=UPI00209F7892|nr:alpha/beta hydrolase [Halorussus salilacus]USZ66692.1 alpha/beta hydrolase [Halorussus salilacus]